MRLFIISGEASGDLHGAHLAKALLQQEPALQLTGWGGDKMQAQGVEILKHYKDLAFMGFVEVAKHLPEILRNFSLCKKQITELKPDAVILVDYPGFNLRMAKWLHKNGYKVFYYIAPQVWAWHSSRIKQIKKYVDLLFPILPFEEKFFLTRRVKAEYFGHPLLDVVNEYKATGVAATEAGVIAILPGSRKQELERMLPTLLEVTKNFPDKKFVIAGTLNLPKYLYTNLLRNYSETKIVFDRTYQLLSKAEAAIVKSGTSTLEAALFNVPEVVVYTMNALTYRIAKVIVKKNISYISLVNLILNKKAVPELIQNDFNVDMITEELRKILSNPNEQKNDYKTLANMLGGGDTAKKVAEKIIENLK